MDEKDPEAVSQALLGAYTRLVKNGIASNVTFAALAREIGMSADQLREFCPGKEELLLMVHKHMGALMMKNVINSVSAHPAGVRRIQVAVNAFLDACLEDRVLRALQVSLRSTSESARKVWQEHRASYEKLLALSFKSIKVSDTEQRAHSLSQHVEEVADSELKAGRALPEMRDTLNQEIAGMTTH